MTNELNASIHALVEYSWDTELRDFEEQQHLGEDTSSHILHSLAVLADHVELPYTVPGERTVKG
jgi:hypothetical protein